MLVLAMDANFRLKNRIIGGGKFDPPLGPGFGYFVEPTKYKEHLQNYVMEQDVSCWLNLVCNVDSANYSLAPVLHFKR